MWACRAASGGASGVGSRALSIASARCTEPITRHESVATAESKPVASAEPKPVAKAQSKPDAKPVADTDAGAAAATASDWTAELGCLAADVAVVPDSEHGAIVR